MKYELDSLNVDEYGSYVFISKRGRKYDLGEISTFQENCAKELISIELINSEKKSFDMVAIIDFHAPDPELKGETIIKLVRWFFGATFLNQDDTVNTIRKYVDEYEKELDEEKMTNGEKIKEILAKENKEMRNYKIVNSCYAGDCRGDIYIQLLNVATEIICDPKSLKDFANEFWQNLYDLNIPSSGLFIGFNTKGYMWDNKINNVNDYRWFRIYDDDGSQYADEIDFKKNIPDFQNTKDFNTYIESISTLADNEKDELYRLAFEKYYEYPAYDGNYKGEVIVDRECINVAFDYMVKEINDNMADCKFEVEAYRQIYDALDNAEGNRYFYIIDEECSYFTCDEKAPEKYYIKYAIRNDDEFTIIKYDNTKED